ncbi:ATP-dependent DNA helicase RecQ [Hymenobacter luteus]|uniref:DNA helicase RecQ n=2 Tax=Hymenobacter TaxID=89966 RepID=A0A7W9SX46_9BACT|nr:DNA helicase RecQ [Hymenobacter latericoloratus]MBB4600163.1 ATP-dependent DNA helicase RecQ [Hymenobacter latericoloratus]MBB6057527.1 ATP-dependent DNA helicase RecQ [Hymenobacter luteus]
MKQQVQREADLKGKLKEVFGYGQFRGVQEDIIQNVIAGNNTFVIMPTGAGKSLCYQLPALVLPGTAIVISPLIALMKNQVDQLNAFGVNAQFLNSTLSKSEMNKVKKDVISGEVKLLYVAPESLTKDETIEFLNKATISFVAIDEAHCISEWGHDFRPEYRKIRSIIDGLGVQVPIIALTATATPKVQQDIQKNLQMDDASVFKTSFNRTNLYYEVRPKHNTKKQLIQYVKLRKGQAGIVYCLSRKKVEEIAELLKVNDVRALPYHAGLDPHVRMANQDAFLNEECDVIVATIAFGMGIDKPDVRFVIHYDTPKSIEGYYQETGRGGRDGLEGDCLMFYSYDDIVKLEKFNKDKPVTERDNSKLLLQEMANYADSAVCRRKQLLHYFGEHFEKDCGFCDNCKHPKERFEAKNEVVMALKAVVQTDERFGLDHIGTVLMGMNNPHVESYGHDQLPIYGQGKEHDAQFWHSLLRQTLLNGYLEKDIENFGVVKITAKGIDFIENPHSIKLTKDHNYEEEVKEEQEQEEVQQAAGHDEALFDMLKALRKKVAQQKNLPPYVLFQDPSLKEMATTFPTKMDDLAHVSGVGQGKAQKFGAPFLALIQKYVDENDIVTAADVVVKSAVNKSKIKIYIIQQIDKKMDLEEIASSKGIDMRELMEEIEHICYSGTKLNLDYYIDGVLDEERQEEIYDYFMTAQTDNIAVALKELGTDDYTEEDLRLMRIKFLSEVAN